MRNIFKTLKPVLLLLSMSVICVGIVWAVNQFKIEKEYPTIDTQATLVTSEVDYTNVIALASDTSTPSAITENTKEEFVLSATSTPNSMCPSDTVNISSESVCSKTSSIDLDVRDRAIVSRSSQVILSAVKVPLELYSGMNVANSNRLITSKEPTYKAAGEQIDETSANVNLPPGSQIDEEKEYVTNEPFSSDYTLAFGGEEDTPTDKGEIGVDTKLRNECEQCNNPSNVNPDKSNKVSEFMYDSLYRTPGEKDTVTEEDLIESCSEGEDQFIPWESDFDGCYLSIPQQAVAIFKTIGDALWNNCKTDPNAGEECVYVEDIVIVMSSPFGSEKDCIDGTCTNAYMSTRNNSALPPASGSSSKVYFTTECKAIIEGKVRNVTCAWDMSHLFKEKKVNEFDDLPEIESTPTDAQYKTFLLEEVMGERNGEEIPL